tara:strand:- start:158 stop:622 length:465 start_codon:yes stop_codon:yes gene_type:complete
MKKYLFLTLIILILLNSCNNNYESEAFTNPINCINMMYKNNLAYLDDILYTGACLVYTSDNKKSRLLSFVEGVPNGKHEGYYYPGEEVEYSGNRKKGEIHGNYVRYHLNGTIHISGKLKKGFRIGKWKFYDNEGKLFEEKKYFNGKVSDSTIYL